MIKANDLHHKITILSQLPLSQVRYSLSPLIDQSETTASLPKYFGLGRYLRGALGYELRMISCVGLCDLDFEHKQCTEPACAYARGFLGLGTSDASPAAYRLHPVVNTNRELIEIGGAEFTLSLFGALSEDHFYWLQGIQRAVRRGLGKEKRMFILAQAIDCLSGEELWNIAEHTFPTLPVVRTLKELIQDEHISQKTPKQLTIQFTSPFESNKQISFKHSKHKKYYQLELYDLLNLIIRRLEQLIETYLLPIEPDLLYHRFNIKEIRQLAESGCIRHSELSKLSKQSQQEIKRGVPRYTGRITYKLDPKNELSPFVVELLRLGQYIGIGRGTVEGRGSYNLSLF